MTVSTRIKMTVDQWFDVDNFPMQRDTERRLARALKRGYLNTFLAPHADVVAVRLPDGALIKVDGHMRGLGWLLGTIARPPVELSVMVYDVANMEEAIAIYKAVDNGDAVKTGADGIYSAYQIIGFKPKSAFLRSCRLSVVLKIAEHARTGALIVKYGRDFDPEVVEWQEELRTADSLLLGHGKCVAALGSAMLITLRRRSSRAYKFWYQYFNAKDIELGASDPVHKLRILVRERTVAKELGAYPQTMDLTQRAISCVEAFIAGRQYTGGVKTTSFQDYLSR